MLKNDHSQFFELKPHAFYPDHFGKFISQVLYSALSQLPIFITNWNRNCDQPSCVFVISRLIFNNMNVTETFLPLFQYQKSVVIPQITSCPRKPQLDDGRNSDHNFFPQHEARKKNQKERNLQNYFSDQLEKIPSKTFLLNKRETQSKQIKIIFWNSIWS